MNLSQIQDYGYGLRVGDLTALEQERTTLLTPEEVASLPAHTRWKDWTVVRGLNRALARSVLNHDQHDKVQQFRAAAFLLACGSPYELELARQWCEAHATEAQHFLSSPPAQTRAA